MLSVGIDFGTTNSSAAVYDGESVTLLPLDPAAPDPRVMRSLIYFQRGGGIFYGRDALNRHLEQNTGREARYEPRSVGEIEMVFAEIGRLVKDTYALIDVNEPGRLFQSLKRFLAMTTFRETNVFGRDYNVEELLSLLARHILESIETAVAPQPFSLSVGWPVRFSQDRKEESTARRRLREAWRLAGRPEVRFVEEPVAAIEHFAATTGVGRRETVVVFDFGGGTLDICLARLVDGRVEVLATAGEALGGDFLDGRIVETQLTPYFGEHATFRDSGLPMPRYIFNRLRSWQTLVELNRPEHMSLISQAREATDQPAQLANLEALIARNYGLAFFQAVEQAKVELSSSDSTFVKLVNDDIELVHALSRESFDAAIAPQVRQARSCVERALTAARLQPEAVSVALTTGGSSLIPAFRDMLSLALPRAQLQAADAFTSVAAGLAIGGYAGREDGM